MNRKLPQLHFISNPNEVKKETMDPNFISTMCALPAPQLQTETSQLCTGVRGQCKCPSAHLKPLPETSGKRNSRMLIANQRCCCLTAWYWWRRKMLKGGKNAPKIIPKLTSEKRTTRVCTLFSSWDWSVGGDGLDGRIGLPSLVLTIKPPVCAVAAEVASQERERKFNNKIYSTPVLRCMRRWIGKGQERGEIDSVRLTNTSKHAAC